MVEHREAQPTGPIGIVLPVGGWAETEVKSGAYTTVAEISKRQELSQWWLQAATHQQTKMWAEWFSWIKVKVKICLWVTDPLCRQLVATSAETGLPLGRVFSGQGSATENGKTFSLEMGRWYLHQCHQSQRRLRC